MLFLHLLVRFCLKKYRVSPIKRFMLETSPFAVTPSTKLPSSSTLSPPSSSLSSLSSISTSPSSLSSSSSSSSSSPLSLNPPSSSSSSSVSFYISSASEVRVLPSYLNSSVFFLTTCFILFIGFRCNTLLTNIYIDLLLLALVFFWKILVLSINDIQNLSCAIKLTVDWC